MSTASMNTAPKIKKRQSCLNKGHIVSQYRIRNPTIIFQICNKSRHDARQCKQQTTFSKPQITLTPTCQLCQTEGHAANMCWKLKAAQKGTQYRERKNQNRDTNNRICYNCRERGHFIRDCPTPIREEYSDRPNFGNRNFVKQTAVPPRHPEQQPRLPSLSVAGTSNKVIRSLDNGLHDALEGAVDLNKASVGLCQTQFNKRQKQNKTQNDKFNPTKFSKNL